MLWYLLYMYSAYSFFFLQEFKDPKSGKVEQYHTIVTRAKISFFPVKNIRYYTSHHHQQHQGGLLKVCRPFYSCYAAISPF